MTWRVVSFGPRHKCLLCLSCSRLLGLAGLAENSLIPTRHKVEPGQVLGYFSEGTWSWPLSKDYLFQRDFGCCSKATVLSAQEMKRGKKKKKTERKKEKPQTTTHWIIIFKLWDLKNKQNVIKNFYSVFWLLIFLLSCVRLFFHLKLTLTTRHSDWDWENPFWGELPCINCLPWLLSFLSPPPPLNPTFFVVQRPALELQNVSGENDRKKWV